MLTCSTLSHVRKVVNYIAKYATKPESRSKGLKTVFQTVVKSLNGDGNSTKVAQKNLISSVGERDYSAQETNHVTLGRASLDFVFTHTAHTVHAITNFLHFHL